MEIDKAIKEKNLYFIGDALPPDWYAAFKLWLPLAHAGDPKAQFNVGRCYDRGDGVDENKIQAKEWYLKAAEQNDPRAFFNLYLFFKMKTQHKETLKRHKISLTVQSNLVKSELLKWLQIKKYMTKGKNLSI